MPTNEECVCCLEYQKIIDTNIAESVEGCITTHPGFHGVCLNRWVLKTAYLQFRAQYGPVQAPAHE